MSKTVDILLVGPGRESDSQVLEKDGLSAQTVATCVDALARVSRARTRVVVLPATEVAGRESAAIRALKAYLSEPPTVFPALVDELA